MGDDHVDQLEALGASDLDDVLELNQRSLPHVGSLGISRLKSIVDECTCALVQRGSDGSLAGFVLVLGPGAAYDSPNYRWFDGHYADFRYVDRIAVDPGVHRSGVGHRLYDAVFDHARGSGAPIVTAEVNVEPPNPVSTAFHQQWGFVEVGRQETYGGSVTVALLGAPVGGSD